MIYHFHMPQKYILKKSEFSPSFSVGFEKDLNPEQLRVIREADGPCLVLAGAGSGKTRTVTYRVAELLKKGAEPRSILLLTFTNKAANEMLERVSALLRTSKSGIWGGTFHSIANRILRTYAKNLGYNEKFVILDQEDAKDVLKICLKDFDIDAKGKMAPSAAVIQNLLSFSRNARVPIAETVEAKYPKFFDYIPQFEEISKSFAKRKLESNSMDFDDLLLKLLELLQNFRDARVRLAGQFKHILVDEYQDTNPIQADIVDALASAHKNILVVGDDAQSIYSFRAATVQNILEFPRRYPGAKIFRLETNYRSTPDILDVANSIIVNNANQFSKRLRAVRESFAKPVIVPAGSSSEEAEFVAQRILELRDEGVALPEVAVLFRATHHSQALEFELMKRGISYEYRGGLKFFERSHIKDALAFLRLCANPKDEVSWIRVLLLGQGIGPATAARLTERLCAVQDISGILRLDLDDLVTPKAASGLSDTLKIFSKLASAKEQAPGVLLRIVAASSYKDYLEAEYPNAEERLEDLEQLALFADRNPDLSSFLSEVSLVDDFGVLRALPGRDSGEERIILSTIHQAKGLEWDTVFLIQMTDANFPNRRALAEEGGLEEERRLFYVSVTRAKRLLYISYPLISGFDSMSIQGPSMFLDEIDRDLLERYEIETMRNEKIIELDEYGDIKHLSKRKPGSYLIDV